MSKLTKRQEYILQFIEERGHTVAKAIIDELQTKFDNVSKPTVLRDLEILLDAKLINKTGGGRSVAYESKEQNFLLKHIAVASYFAVPPDNRPAQKNFNWEVFNHLHDLFSNTELKYLDNLNHKYLQKKRALSPVVLKKELERLTIELSWKSSELEGNTYSLIDTEVLIKEHKEAPGHTKEEAFMILNHKQALDYVLARPDRFKKISLGTIRSLHALLIKNLGIPDDYRKGIVGIIGTNYKPLDNQFQIREAMEKLVSLINSEEHSAVKAMVAIVMVAYIQPFMDGNKRTGRILGNALLLAHDWCPMSLRSMGSTEYKKAIILFYEQNNLKYFKELFMQQFEFAVNNYFG